MAGKKTKVMIVQHDGTKYQTEVEDYNAEALNEEITNGGRNTVAIGDLILSPASISRIVPVKE